MHTYYKVETDRIMFHFLLELDIFLAFHMQLLNSNWPTPSIQASIEKTQIATKIAFGKNRCTCLCMSYKNINCAYWWRLCVMLLMADQVLTTGCHKILKMNMGWVLLMGFLSPQCVKKRPCIGSMHKRYSLQKVVNTPAAFIWVASTLLQPSEEFELTANSLWAHLKTHGKLILKTLI